MILADSLQILENEAVQSAIKDARGTGLLIGSCIMAGVLFFVLFLYEYLHKRELNDLERSDAMSKYIRLKLEMGWVEMVDICKRCIEGDIRISKPIITLFNDFPTYDAERMAKEVQFFPDITKRYQELMDDRTAVVETLEDMVSRDIESLHKEMAQIELKYPEETAAYNKKHKERKEQISKNQNDNNGATES